MYILPILAILLNYSLKDYWKHFRKKNDKLNVCVLINEPFFSFDKIIFQQNFVFNVIYNLNCILNLLNVNIF